MSLVTPLLWSLLPSQITHLILPYLTHFLPFIFPPSPRGTPTYAYNYKCVFSLVVLGYLSYTFFLEREDRTEDWYGLLGCDRGADDDTLKKAFRNL